MAVSRINTQANMILKALFSHRPIIPWSSFSSSTGSSFATSFSASSSPLGAAFSGIRFLPAREFTNSRIVCAAASDENKKLSSTRFTQVHQLIQEAEKRAAAAGNEPIPQITLDHVTMSFARSGGAGGQNVNKVNTKVDMRFNVKNAYWLSDRIRERIMQMEKNRINKDGEIVISSTKTRTQKGNIDDALAKLQVIK
ncbi:hypothetical protein Tsubulata_013525 [Turnera subulata]|uniref:Prokaryotic-type class I peptide chain release factors domain-containing protein n=1 Tax=Turnera subulata TaxID=218843 RepID=A0A9Q0JMX1_9ROSI|nr:hypothetical protein Tsubulata_013525 [Turnera subulata]